MTENVFAFKLPQINKSYKVFRSMGAVRLSSEFLKYALHFEDSLPDKTDDLDTVEFADQEFDAYNELMDKVLDLFARILPDFTDDDKENLEFSIDVKTGINLASDLCYRIQGASEESLKAGKSGKKSQSSK